MCSPQAEIDGRRRISKRGGGGIGSRRRWYWQPAAAVSMAGSALALSWRRGLAEDMRLGVADFMAMLVSSRGVPMRRIGRSKRRRRAALGSATAGGDARAARRRSLGFAGTGARVLK
jgi:hypothetical protein